MIVTAALIWYDEKPEDLAACVRGAAVAADRIVAVDGGYRRFPNAQPASPVEQADTIMAVADEMGLRCDIRIPRELWAGQVAKRSFLLAQASLGSDWVAVVDTDWICSGDREAVRDELLHATSDVLDVPFYTPPGEAIATGWHRDQSGTRTRMPHFLRALPGLRVEGLHWQYSAVKDGERVWLWHRRDRQRRVLPMGHITAPYEIEHRTLLRDERHVLAGRAFCNDRVMVLARTGQEDDVPGLPPPVFDYETVPYT